MSQVLVWKSDADGKLFEDKKKYQAHLRKLAAKRRQERKIEEAKRNRVDFLNRMGQVASIDELNQFIKDNWAWFFANGLSRRWYDGKRHHDFHEYVEVELTNMRFGNHGNTHSCPRNGGVQNFMQRDEFPKKYPGWYGRLNIKVKPGNHKYKGQTYMRDGFGSDYFEETGICTGSGGGGSGEDCKSYSYDVKIWAADFPVMWEEQSRKDWISLENRERERQWKALGGDTKTIPVIPDVPENWITPDPLKEARIQFSW
jgi:hypothetical protein